jgi:hypothetical protein
VDLHVKNISRTSKIPYNPNPVNSPSCRLLTTPFFGPLLARQTYGCINQLSPSNSAALVTRVSSSAAISVLRVVAVDELGALAAAMVDGSSRVFTFQSSFDVIVRVSDLG